MGAIRTVSMQQNNNEKQCCTPERTEEVGATIKDLKDTEVVIPITSTLNLSVWSVQKANGS